MLQSQLETLLKRALAAAQLLQTLHACQCTHGGLNPQALHFLGDGSLRLRPPARTPNLSLEQLRYAAPEQASRLSLADARSDLYSLGLILYEWLLQRPAFTTQDPLQLAYQQIAMLPTPPHQLDPRLPQPVSALVMRLLAKPPDARYASAQGLADDLQHCLQQWESQGAVQPFALGSTDQQALFSLPERLYGRGEPMAQLVQLWRQAAQGSVQLCMVGAEAGMGKTSLVRALRDTVLESGGMLLEGRFAPEQPPYAALGDALRKRLRQLMAGTQAELLHWRTRLQTCLGERVRLLQALLPELQWICPPTSAEPVPAAAATPQHHAALLDLLCLFTGSEQPLLLFLDDLHCADLPSIALVHALLHEPRASHVLLVCSYCDAPQALATTPLARLRNTLRQEARPVVDIRLAPLDDEELGALIDDCCFRLHNLPALLQRTQQVTQGRPAAVLQFLSQQVREGHLCYESQNRRWCWTEGSAPVDHAAALTALWWRD